MKSKQIQTLQFENTPIGFVEWDVDFRVKEWDQAAGMILGYTKDEALGQHANFIVPHAYRAQIDQVWEDLMAQTGGSRSTNKNIRKNGDEVLCEWYNTTLRDSDGKSIGVASLVLDITERDRLSRQLIHEKEFTQLALDSQLDTFFVFEPSTGKALHWNKQFREQSGYSDEEIESNKAPDSYYSSVDLARAKDFLGNVMKAGSGTIVLDLITKTGQTIPTEYSVSIISEDDEDPQYIISIGRDIRERISAENIIKESQVSYQNLFNQIADPIVIFDQKTHHFLDCNKTMLETYGYSKEELLAMTPFDLHPPEDLEKVNENINDKTDIAPNEYIHITKSGVVINVEVHTQDIHYKGREAWISIIRDITSRKEVEQELLRAKEKAEESDQLKSAFLANMSHEIRTPMNAILGFTELLGDPDQSREEFDQCIQVINQSGQRLMGIINDLIDISKIEAGQISLYKLDINLDALITQLHQEFKPEADKKGLDLSIERSQSEEDTYIHSDKTRLTQILANLIKNALKFTRKGFVRFGYIKHSDHIEFFVSDSGIGIPSEDQQKIFERFIQIDMSRSRYFEGTGLGLSISRALVQKLGGEIRVQSVFGEGSTFYFTIPVK